MTPSNADTARAHLDAAGAYLEHRGNDGGLVAGALEAAETGALLAQSFATLAVADALRGVADEIRAARLEGTTTTAQYLDGTDLDLGRALDGERFSKVSRG